MIVACGMGAAFTDLALYVFLFGALALTVILSLRSANQSLARMAKLKPTTGLKIVHGVSLVAYAAAIAVGVLYSLALVGLML